MRLRFPIAILALLLPWMVVSAAEWSGIHVTGSGEIRAVPDMARLSLEVRREGQDAAALKSQLDEVTAAVLKMAAQMGIDKRHLTAASVSIHPRYRHRDGDTEIDGLIASRSIEVVLVDLADMSKLINGALQRGANGIGGVRLDLSNREELEQRALDLAIDDARDEAARVARRFGVHLGPLADVVVDQREVRPLMMEAMVAKTADSGPDFSPGEISIRRNVQSTFSIGESVGG